ncbi:hypothetical protein [Hyphomicrobium sulfonivorans]|uniref:hypothetical protein n=1 Tax=Hyphomicrobium sulfonivorans TaxID=121290 RepID=UPI001570E94F|nr:hypothetical protein [Hyphomicrobium sulfonivorans]MBI1650707.1 hypothetical protein [Hyphomicrobium sulfonivorans]NSL71935.1 hypothetical protein [Hyphomicrobium sulfonivorans]
MRGLALFIIALHRPENSGEFYSGNSAIGHFQPLGANFTSPNGSDTSTDERFSKPIIPQMEICSGTTITQRRKNKNAPESHPERF